MTLRLIDANLDRVGEGLRVLEDVARFLLNDASLSEQLKVLRHELLRQQDYSLQQQLLASRRAEEDVGAFVETVTEGQRHNLPSLVMANARRVQESLRVLEEFSKLPGAPPALNSSQFKRARFTLYELEQRLVFRLLRKQKVQELSGLYLILDIQALQDRSEMEVARQAIQGGAKVIQLRDKKHTKQELLPIATELKRLCAAGGVLFIVNDYLDIALAVEADGLHLGQEDLPLPVARRLVPEEMLLGCSTATVAEAVKAEQEGADYIAVGSLFPTMSKEKVRMAGLETLRQVKQRVSLPIIGIGGINAKNVEQVIRAGASGVAVISAVLGAEDVEQAAHQMATKLKEVESSLEGENGKSDR